MSDYEYEVNISKYLHKSSLGTCEKEYLSQKPASAKGAHPVREQGLIISVHHVPICLSPPQMPFQLPALCISSHSCWPKITHKHHPQKNPVSQTSLKSLYLAHNLQIKHTGHSSLLLRVSQNTSLGKPLFWEIPDLHKGGCVLTWTTTQKVSASAQAELQCLKAAFSSRVGSNRRP